MTSYEMLEASSFNELPLEIKEYFLDIFDQVYEPIDKYKTNYVKHEIVNEEIEIERYTYKVGKEEVEVPASTIKRPSIMFRYRDIGDIFTAENLRQKYLGICDYCRKIFYKKDLHGGYMCDKCYWNPKNF